MEAFLEGVPFIVGFTLLSKTSSNSAKSAKGEERTDYPGKPNITIETFPENEQKKNGLKGCV